jgi:anti-anti-sigma factor
MQLDVSDEIAIIQFTVRALVDERIIQSVGEEFLRLVQETGYRYIAINFGTVTHLSSQMLAKIILLHHTLKNLGGKLALCAIAPNIYEVFQVTKLNQRLNIFPDEAEAIEFLRPPR